MHDGREQRIRVRVRVRVRHIMEDDETERIDKRSEQVLGADVRGYGYITFRNPLS